MKRMMVIIAALTVAAAACSASDEAEAPATTTTTVPATTTPSTLSETTTTTTVAASTSSTTSTTAAPASEIVAGEDPDVDAVVLAYEVVFSSKTTFEEKAPYIDDPSGLEDTVAKYQETGESMGGVELVPTAVEIDGETATVGYDLYFGGSPTYPDLTGDAILLDDTWKITRVMFCGMMASARVGCPES